MTNKKGPKKSLTIENIQPAIKRTKGNLAAVGRAFGITRQAVHQFVRDHDLIEMVEEQRESKLDEAEDILWEAVKEGKTAELLFFLKTQGRSRGYIEKSEVDNKGEMTITVRYENDAD